MVAFGSYFIGLLCIHSSILKAEILVLFHHKLWP